MIILAHLVEVVVIKIDGWKHFNLISGLKAGKLLKE